MAPGPKGKGGIEEESKGGPRWCVWNRNPPVGPLQHTPLSWCVCTHTKQAKGLVGKGAVLKVLVCKASKGKKTQKRVRNGEKNEVPANGLEEDEGCLQPKTRRGRHKGLLMCLRLHAQGGGKEPVQRVLEMAYAVGRQGRWPSHALAKIDQGDDVKFVLPLGTVQ